MARTLIAGQTRARDATDAPSRPEKREARDRRIDGVVCTLFLNLVELGSQCRRRRARLADPALATHRKRPGAVVLLGQIERQILACAAPAAACWIDYSLARRLELIGVTGLSRWPAADASREAAEAWFIDEFAAMYGIERSAIA